MLPQAGKLERLSPDLNGTQVILTTHVKAEAGMGKSVALIDGDGVGDTVTRVQDNSRGTSGAKRERTAWLAT